MKKNVILLTGIVVLISLLAAGGCQNGPKKNVSEVGGPNLKAATADSTELKPDSTTVRIYLKDRIIDGSMHLEMYNEKKPDCPVIDGLITVVYPGYTVIFKKAHKSNVNRVKNIVLEEEYYSISSEDVKVDSGLYVIVIDTSASYDTIVKYDIIFTVKQDTTSWRIDPYLKIPPKPPTP